MAEFGGEDNVPPAVEGTEAGGLSTTLRAGACIAIATDVMDRHQDEQSGESLLDSAKKKKKERVTSELRSVMVRSFSGSIPCVLCFHLGCEFRGCIRAYFFDGVTLECMILLRMFVLLLRIVFFSLCL